MLNEDGWLEVVYLGTEPPKSAIPNLEAREQSYEDLNSKLLEINERLEAKESQGDSGEVLKDTNEKLNIRGSIRVGVFVFIFHKNK